MKEGKEEEGKEREGEERRGAVKGEYKQHNTQIMERNRKIKEK